MDDVFTIKEAMLYLGAAAVLVIGWFWANPMKRIEALEKLLMQHVQTNASEHQQRQIEILDLKSHAAEKYSTKTETSEAVRRVEDSVREGFKEMKDAMRQQSEKSDDNFATLYGKIDRKQDKQ